MNKRLGNVVAAAVLAAMAQVGVGAGPEPSSRPPHKCSPSSFSRRPCRLPPMPLAPSKPRREAALNRVAILAYALKAAGIRSPAANFFSRTEGADLICHASSCPAASDAARSDSRVACRWPWSSPLRRGSRSRRSCGSAARRAGAGAAGSTTKAWPVMNWDRGDRRRLVVPIFLSLIWVQVVSGY